MDKIKVKFGGDVYSILPNDGNPENVVFTCNTRNEWTKYLTSLPKPPVHIVVAETVQNL